MAATTVLYPAPRYPLTLEILPQTAPVHLQDREVLMVKRQRRATTRSKRNARRPARWSQRVTEESDALDLDQGVFRQTSPKRIAASLKRSAERSRRRKSDPYRSAMSMLTFFINRAGKNLPASRKRILERAKHELRTQFGRK
jgi:hypothetical protein